MILILYFIIFLLMIATYLRTLLTITFDCGVVPLGPLAVERRKNSSSKGKGSQRSVDTEGYPYWAGPDLDPDSPGLEQFYTKDVFVCESDGRPKWCSECCNWKPDRVHHSSEVDRCVYRMDHYCPWVGGMIGENGESMLSDDTCYDHVLWDENADESKPSNSSSSSPLMARVTACWSLQLRLHPLRCKHGQDM